MENDIQTVGAASLCAAVTLRDLSDPEQGDHAMQQIVSAVVERLRSAWGCAGQKNVLVRLTIRDLERSLTSAEANVLRDRVYRELHRGTKLELSPAAKT